MARVTQGPRINSNVDLSIGGKSYTSGQVSQTSVGLSGRNPSVGAVSTITVPVSQAQSVQIREELSRWGTTENVTTGTAMEEAKIAHTYSLISPSISDGVKTQSDTMQNFVRKNNQEYYDAKSGNAHLRYEEEKSNPVRNENNGSVTAMAYQAQEQMGYLREDFQRLGRTEAFTTGTYMQAQEVARNSSHFVSQNEIHTLAEMSRREYMRGVGVTVSYTVNSEAKTALEKIKNNFNSTDFISGSTIALDKVRGTMSNADDVGTQTVGDTLAVTSAGLGAFRLAQTTGVDTVKKIGNGVYEVAVTGKRGIITIAQTGRTVFERQAIPLSRETFEIFKEQSRLSGLSGTKLAQGIVHKVDAIRTGFATARNYGIRTLDITKSTVKTSVEAVKVVWGVTTGRMTVVTAAQRLIDFRNRTVPGLKTAIRTGIRTTGGFAARGAAKGASVTVFRGVPAGVKTLKRGVVSTGGALMATDNLGTQALGAAITGTDIALKTAKTGTKVAIGTVKTATKGTKFVGRSVKTGVKTTARAIEIARTRGVRALWQHAKSGFQQMMRQAARSVISLVLNVGKLLLAKIAIPLAIIVVVVVALVAITNVPATFLSTVFTGTFYDGGIETDVRTYLNSNVPQFADNYKQDLANQMQNDKNSYDIVRFYSNTGNGDVVEPTLAGVSQVFPTNEELTNMLHPMYNSLIIAQYGFEPSANEAKDLVKVLFEGNGSHKGLFRITTQVSPVDIPVEFCGQALSNGEGTPVTHSCGEIHALGDCPNTITGTHTRYTCSECDYYVCKGHKGSLNCGKSEHMHDGWLSPEFPGCYGLITCGNDLHMHTVRCYSLACGLSEHSHRSWNSASDSGCYSTTYCNNGNKMSTGCTNCEFKCDGYEYCGSHSVKVYRLTLDGIYALEQEYFGKPINELSNKNPRTADEEKELQNLKDYYAIYKELMGFVAKEYGSGMSSSDLGGVNFVNGSRVGNQSVVDLALSQVGQQGGQPYWSYYGFASRVEWCACFVHWVMRNTPTATAAYPDTANNAYCPTIASNFQSLGQWGDRGYTDLVAGDTIFFDWEGDGVTDHIGIVVGQDGSYVYTVEGNSMDVVAVRQYEINSPVIYGYGLMNY